MLYHHHLPYCSRLDLRLNIGYYTIIMPAFAHYAYRSLLAIMPFSYWLFFHGCSCYSPLAMFCSAMKPGLSAIRFYLSRLASDHIIA